MTNPFWSITVYGTTSFLYETDQACEINIA